METLAQAVFSQPKKEKEETEQQQPTRDHDINRCSVHKHLCEDYKISTIIAQTSIKTALSVITSGEK